MAAEVSAPTLAPEPEFRYVGLEPGPRSRAGGWASAAVGAATLGAGLWHGATPRGVALAAIAAVTGVLAFRRAGGPSLAKRWGGRPVVMGIVPWGVLVEPDGEARVLRWAALERVEVETLHGKDEATSTTLFSVVTVATRKGEVLVGRAPGAVPLDGLMAHLDAYAREQTHAVALDLHGDVEGPGPLEPEVEPLLSAVPAWLRSSAGMAELDLSPAGYRSAGARAASERSVEILGAVLRDRRARRVDPRAFAAVCAAELRARELADEIVTLVQSPHPLVAAVAKSAARKLGVPTARAGALEEVGPFLMEEDLAALRAWQEGA